MLQFHKTLHTHKVVVHPRHLPLLRLPGGTCIYREREGGRDRKDTETREGKRKSSSESNGALEKKRQEGRIRASGKKKKSLDRKSRQI